MNGTEAERDTRTAESILIWSLRICGSVDLLALIAFIMPLEWIRQTHQWFGFGHFPEGPIPEYLARATSLLWGMHGALLMYLSRDVATHARLLAFVAWLTVAGGVLLLVLAMRTNLPVWWVAIEGPVFAASGLWYLWWLGRR